MTEEQALKKWCPFVRYEGDNGGTFGRGLNRRNPTNKGALSSDYECNCIATACALWSSMSKGYGHCGMINSSGL